MDVEFSFTVCECKKDISEKNEDKKEVHEIDKETAYYYERITQNFLIDSVMPSRLLNPNSGYVNLEAHVQKNSRVM